MYSVGCHNIVLNWITEIADLQFFVVLIKLSQIMHHEKWYCLFGTLNVNFFLRSSQKNIIWPIKSVVVAIRGEVFFLNEEKTVFALISGRVSVTKTVGWGSILCLAFSNKKGLWRIYSVWYRWTSVSLTRRPKISFAVSWPKQLGE